MTVIAPSLDTGGGAIFFRIRAGIARRGAVRTVRATDWERLDWKLDGSNMCSICQSSDDVAI